MEPMYFEEIESEEKTAGSVLFEVTKEEIIEFAGRWDPRPFHIDEAAAVSSVFGGFVACSAHVFSILSWFAAQPERHGASLAALGFDEVRLHHPFARVTSSPAPSHAWIRGTRLRIQTGESSVTEVFSPTRTGWKSFLQSLPLWWQSGLD